MYFFDVCGTLFKVNTTFSFIKYFHMKRKNYFRLFLVILFLSIVGKILNKYFKISIRSILIYTLKNESLEKLEEIANIFVTDILDNEKIDQIFNIFNENIHLKNKNVILISASIDPVINALGRRYKVKTISSQIEYDNGVSTGKLLIDIRGNKNLLMKNFTTQESVFYTDNIDDLNCSNIVNKIFFIVKNKKKIRSIKLSNNTEIVYV